MDMRLVKGILDYLATLAVIVVSAVLVWVLLSSRPAVSRAEASRPEPPLPTAPITLPSTGLQGNPAAPLALMIYSDFQCPFCGEFARTTLPRLQDVYVQPGTLLLAFRHFPLSRLHPYAEKAAVAAECAGAQGRFWEMHDQIFLRAKTLSDAALRQEARALSLKMPAFESCLASGAAGRIKEDLELGRQLQVTGTPTFFVGPLDSDRKLKVARRFSGILSFEQFAGVLDGLIQDTRRKTAGR